MEQWLQSAPPLKRLAFGTILLEAVENHRAASERLDSYLPFVQLDPNSSDFHFKINRPRPSQCGIERLTINRLMTWSLFRWQIGVTLSQGAAGERRDLVPASGLSCRLELDISSSSDFEGPIPRDNLTRLWRELVQLAKEIAAEGDKP
jgi:hypothetical protein